MKKLLLFCFISVFAIETTNAQQDFLMYNLNEIPQSVYSNPSNQFHGKAYLGLPLLSSNYFSLSNSGFAYSDAIQRQNDSLLLDLDALISELEDENFTSFNVRLDLFSFGFRIGKRTQFSFNVTENVAFRFNYTKDFIRFINEGNTAFEDNVADFNNLGLSLFHYREFGVGLSHQFTRKLRLGARAKLLYGMGNIFSEKTDVSLSTNPETFALTGNADVAIRTSGLGVLDSLDVGDYFTERDNQGFALDLGINYQLNDRISLNASILDLGSIDWSTDIENYVVDNGEYTYSGIDINDFILSGNDTTGEDSFDTVLDSLEEAFDIEENTEEYSTPLPTRIYAGVNYKLGKRTVLGGLFQTEYFRGTDKPSFRSSVTISANQKITKWITFAASFTAINRSFNSIGFGFNINPGPFQLYVVSDNVLGAFQPQNARHAQLRFGLNFIFGGGKTKELHPLFKNDGLEKKSKKEKKEEKGEEQEEDSKE